MSVQEVVLPQRPRALAAVPDAGPAAPPPTPGPLPGAVRAGLRDAFVAALDAGRDLRDDELAALHDVLGEAVRCGIELSAVLDDVALAQADAWAAWLERLRLEHGEHPDCAAAIAGDSVRFFGLAERSRASVIERYLAALDEWSSSAEALRAQLVRRILAGEPVEPETAAERLGHDLSGRHVAVLVWPLDPGARSGDVRPCAARAARRLGDGTDPVLLDVEGGACVAWARPRPGRPSEGDALQGVLPEGLAAAVGAPREGIDGFRRTFTDARFAQQALLARAARDDRVVRFADVALLALLTTDVDEAARFVDEVLGELAGPAPGTRRVAETLRLYFELGASAIGTARHLAVHQNTVLNRLRRAAELLGHPLDERAHEVWTALRLDLWLRTADPHR